MRKGQLALDLPRFMTWHTPAWMNRLSFIIWLVCLPFWLAGQWWAFAVFGAWALFTFAWCYRLWRVAGSPAIDVTPTAAQAVEQFKQLWRRGGR